MNRSQILGTVFVAMCIGCGPKPAPVSPAGKPQPSVAAAEASEDKPTVAIPRASTESAAFPGAWTGVYIGEVQARSPRGEKTFGMELHIQPIEQSDRYQWKLVYLLANTEKPDEIIRNERDYEMVTVNVEKGQFQVDEKNGIVIDAQLYWNTLYTAFSVDEAVLDIRYHQVDDGIVFDVVSTTPSQAKSASPSSQTSVKNNPLAGVQRAHLVRQ